HCDGHGIATGGFQVRAFSDHVSDLVTAVDAVRFGVDLLDDLLDPPVTLRPSTRRPVDRIVIARRGNVQDIAHHRHRKRVAVFADPGVLHSDSFAKYAV